MLCHYMSVNLLVVAFGRTTMQSTMQNPIRAKSQYHSRQKPVDAMTDTHHQVS